MRELIRDESKDSFFLFNRSCSSLVGPYSCFDERMLNDVYISYTQSDLIVTRALITCVGPHTIQTPSSVQLRRVTM